MFVSRGLVGPKAVLNRGGRKGSRLIFLRSTGPCPMPDASGQAERGSHCVQALKPPESRNGEKGVKA